MTNRPHPRPLACRSLSLLLVLAGALAGQKDGGPDPRAAFVSGVPVPAGSIAVIDGATVPLPELIATLHNRFANHDTGQKVLNTLLQERLIVENARRRNLVLTEKEVDDEYRRLDAQVRKETDGKKDIDALIADQGLTKDLFLEKLRIQALLASMTRKDFGREEVLPADQIQWLRSKTLEAEVERDPAKLPEDAAAKVYDDFITKEEFARMLINVLEPDETLKIVQSMMQEILARQLFEGQGGQARPEDFDREYDRMRARFERDPKFKGLVFADFIREREGMSPEAHKRSPGFRREAFLAMCGKSLVSDEAAPRIYEEQQAYYGPIYELRHILVRGRDPAKQKRADKEPMRTMEEAHAEALKIRDRLDKGESFDDCVKLFSEDPKTRFTGGGFGEYTPKSAEQQGIAEAMLATKEGGWFGPIQSAIGWHVIAVGKKRPAPPLDADIVDDLRLRAAHEAFGEGWRKAVKGIDLRPLLPRGKKS